ncbi:YheC/YheD family protein [Alteribacter keqinensis]|uniref:YheC/YheD family protein n=1 Tax=Alteribacter keqinensis TaxID=2483800 RepID=A0A3M7TQ24_9BACI|nr:YheC/YheD family protein [Alteribacter keqinensis]RNA66779.1 hypothetical protein EBO34_16345 [Alteribacter keqinensis]
MTIVWVKVLQSESGNSHIVVPEEFPETFRKYNSIQHGLLHVSCEIITKKGTGESGDIDSPLTLNFSKEVMEKLYLFPGVKYQVIAKGDTIKIGPLTGMTVSNDKSTGVKRVRDYSRTGGIFVAFKKSNINWEAKTVVGRVYAGNEKKWQLATVPLPDVIYRRGSKFSDELITKYKEMGGTLFNTRPLYKGNLDTILSKDETLKEFIIEQRDVNTIGDIFIMVYRFKKIVIKPKAGVGGNGVLFIEKIGWNRFKVADYKNVRNAMKKILSTNQLISFIKERNLSNGRFIVQKWIQFKTYKGNPVDIRVHMQKNDEGWVCSGVECRVAASGQQVTNLAKGGEPLTFETVMESEPEIDELKDKLIAVCKMIGEAIDQAYPDDCFADIGMDVALDSAGKIWFIEANCCPLFKGFKKISPLSYRAICQRPIYYSTSKQGFIIDL